VALVKPNKGNETGGHPEFLIEGGGGEGGGLTMTSYVNFKFYFKNYVIKTCLSTTVHVIMFATKFTYIQTKNYISGTHLI